MSRDPDKVLQVLRHCKEYKQILYYVRQQRYYILIKCLETLNNPGSSEYERIRQEYESSLVQQEQEEQYHLKGNTTTKSRSYKLSVSENERRSTLALEARVRKIISEFMQMQQAGHSKDAIIRDLRENRTQKLQRDLQRQIAENFNEAKLKK